MRGMIPQLNPAIDDELPELVLDEPALDYNPLEMIELDFGCFQRRRLPSADQQ